MRYLSYLLAALFAWSSAPASAQVDQQRCDWPAFENPCEVKGGVYRALAPRGTGPHKTILYLYGSTGHSREVTEASFFQRIVDRYGYALVVPGALDIRYRGGFSDTGWTLRNGKQKTRNEIEFLKNVMNDAAYRFGLDLDNVLVMGQSRGGFLIWEIACHNPEIGSAYAVHAGGYLGRLPGRCQQPVKFLHTHGAQDKIVDYGGMENVSGNVDMRSIPDAMKMLERTNGCDERSLEPTSTVPNFARYTYSNCAPGSALELMLHKGGHDYPANWIKVAIDWFEDVNAGPSLLPSADPTAAGKSIRFKGAGASTGFGTTTSRSRFKSVPKQ
ncbi:MAG: hypothetical protein AAGE80_08415 [Pseudomonadota bacterium]